MPSQMTLLKIFLLSLLFTVSLFFATTYFSLNFSEELAEENYIEKSLYKDQKITQKEVLIETEEISVELEASPEEESITETPDVVPVIAKEDIRQVFFTYIPNTLKISLPTHRRNTLDFINDGTVSEKIKSLTVEFHKDMVDVRGTMKNKTIKIFDPLDMSDSEFLWVFVHEFAHYLDLYFFSKNPFWDPSEDFYAISWESTKTMKAAQNSSDFVSGYAMTNKYEDFAESLTYYIFHNKDFESKASKSQHLAAKYMFFRSVLFKGTSFYWTDFSSAKVKKYYWDITKIEIDTQNFLQYLKKDI